MDGLDQLLVQAREFVVCFSTDWSRITYLSPSGQEILGYQNAEWLDNTQLISVCLHPHFRFAQARVTKAIKNGRESVRDVSVIWKTKSGGLLECVHTFMGRRNKDGHLVEYTSIGRELTQSQKIVDERNRLFFMAYDLLAVFDLEGYFRQVNPAWERTLGVSTGELLGQPFWNFVHPRDLQRVHSAVEKLCCGESIANVDVRFACRHGHYRWLSLSAVPLLEKGLVYATVRDVTDRKALEDEIRFLSFHDKLTRLYNRAYFDSEVSRLDVARQLPLSIIIADVNGLKLTNDAFGHHEGDELLCQAAQALRSSCREEDILARWGGDEFAVLLPQTGREETAKIVSRIRQACGQIRHLRIPVSMALGWAVKENPRACIHNVIRQAEEEMYRVKLLEGKEARNSIIESLKRSLVEMQIETSEHLGRVQRLAVSLGELLALSEGDIEDLTLLAAVHDIGKTAISRNIFSKKGPLTEEELREVRKHSEIGYRIALNSPELSPIAEDILSHHEWWDGNGYPQGLAEKDIPLNSRILAIVDAFDVMTTGRIYRAPLTTAQALSELRNCAGTQFDPHLVDRFIDVVDRSYDNLEVN